VLGAAYVLSLTAAFLWIRGRRRLTAYVVTTGLGLLVLVPLTKVLVGRERPRVPVPVTDLPVTDSFPSGHAMTSLVTWVVVALVISPSVRNRLRPWLLAMALLLAAAIGATRLALGVHYLSDVLAGWALGAGWLAVTTALFRAWQSEEGRVSPRVGQGLEEHGTWLAPVHDRLLPDGGRALARLAGAAAALVALATGLCALAPATGPALPANAVLAALSAPWTLLATTVAVSVLVLAVSRRRRPALLPPIAVLGAVVVVLLAAAGLPGAPVRPGTPQRPPPPSGRWPRCSSYGGGPRGAGPGSSRPRPSPRSARAPGTTPAGRPSSAAVLVGTGWLVACTRWQLLPAGTGALPGGGTEGGGGCRRPPIGSRLRPGLSRGPPVLRMSTLFLRTLREDPADAEVPSHRLLVRAGYVRRVAPGIYSWLPLGVRMLANVSRIVREEMDRIGPRRCSSRAAAQGALRGERRWTEYGDLLFR
jgi:undecaprenyl-diphosphatase